jgi:hypothetical protein
MSQGSTPSVTTVSLENGLPGILSSGASKRFILYQTGQERLKLG